VQSGGARAAGWALARLERLAGHTVGRADAETLRDAPGWPAVACRLGDLREVVLSGGFRAVMGNRMQSGRRARERTGYGQQCPVYPRKPLPKVVGN
jgi:hypothetical protein